MSSVSGASHVKPNGLVSGLSAGASLSGGGAAAPTIEPSRKNRAHASCSRKVQNIAISKRGARTILLAELPDLAKHCEGARPGLVRRRRRAGSIRKKQNRFVYRGIRYP